MIKQNYKIMCLIIVAALCGACSETKTPDYFKKHPKDVIKTEMMCVKIANEGKNPFKDKNCYNVALFEHDQCQQSNNYLEKANCGVPQYLISRSLVSDGNIFE